MQRSGECVDPKDQGQLLKPGPNECRRAKHRARGSEGWKWPRDWAVALGVSAAQVLAKPGPPKGTLCPVNLGRGPKHLSFASSLVN